MSCSITLAGLTRDCEPSRGGIVAVWFADVNASGGAPTVTVSSGEISAVSGGTWLKYKFPKNTGSVASAYNINEENGTKYVESTLTLVFNRMETAKRVEICALAQGELVAIVKDANGKYWYLGKDEPLILATGEGNTGTARADRNGYNVTLKDVSNELPYECLKSGLPVAIDE